MNTGNNGMGESICWGGNDIGHCAPVLQHYVKQHWKLNPVCHVKPRCNRGCCVVKHWCNSERRAIQAAMWITGAIQCVVWSTAAIHGVVKIQIVVWRTGAIEGVVLCCVVKHCCNSDRCAMESVAWGVSSIQAVMWMAGAIQGVVWNTVMIHGVVKIQSVVWSTVMIHGVVKIHSVVTHQCDSGRSAKHRRYPEHHGDNGTIPTAVVCFPSCEFKRSLRGQLVSYRGQCRCIVRNFADHGSNIMSVFSLNMWLLHLAS